MKASKPTPNTTGEAKFPDCHGLPRVSKIGHLGKPFFPECCTRGRIALGEERLPRVPYCIWHSGKSGTRGRPSSPSVTLGEEPHPGKKNVIWRPNSPAPLQLKIKKSSPSALFNTRGRRPFPSAKTWLSVKRLASPSAVVLALGEGSLPREPGKTLGEEFLLLVFFVHLFSFFCPIFLWGLQHLLPISFIVLSILRSLPLHYWNIGFKCCRPSC